MTPDVKALEATIEIALGEGEELSYFGANGNIDPKFTAGRIAYAALLQHVARLEAVVKAAQEWAQMDADAPMDEGIMVTDHLLGAVAKYEAALAPTAAAPGGEEVG